MAVLAELLNIPPRCGAEPFTGWQQESPFFPFRRGSGKMGSQGSPGTPEGRLLLCMLLLVLMLMPLLLLLLLVLALATARSGTQPILQALRASPIRGGIVSRQLVFVKVF